MSAIRLPLLCAFASGCVCSAILIGLARSGADSAAPAAKRGRSPRVEHAITVKAAPSGAQRAEATTEPERAGADTPAPRATRAPDSEVPEPAGSAVSDVLMDLEAAYRARVAASAPARSDPLQERATAAVSSGTAVAPTASSAPPITQSAALTAVTPASMFAPAGAVSAGPAAVAAAQVTAAPALAASGDLRPSEVHIGDVTQNTYLSNVRQGDVYLIQVQQMQMQQLAMLQYMQLLGLSSGFAGPERRARGAVPQSAPFSSTLTNPDNPWGFHFTPPDLVH